MRKKKKEEEKRCSVCDFIPSHEADLIDHEGHLYCNDCFESEYPACAHCGNRQGNFESMVSINDDLYCERCQDTYLATCFDCDEYELPDNVFYISGLDRHVCGSCFDDGYFMCNGCERNLHNDEYSIEGLCQRCDEPATPVKSYSTDVLAYCRADLAKRLFGVELEVATQVDYSKIAEETNELVSGDAILKEDSSIDTNSYEGFEIVTRPMTLENQFKFWNKFLDNCNENLRSYDVGTCGLHVHVTRSSISRLTLGKLLVFVNAECNKPLIKRIAQRYNCGFSAKKEKALTSTTNNDRYEFINLQKGYTIEFRLFRGTLNRTRLLACLEFTATLIEFCQQASIRDMTTPKFLEYVSRQPKLKCLKTIFRLKGDDSIENGIGQPEENFSIPVRQFENELVRLRPRTPLSVMPF